MSRPIRFFSGKGGVGKTTVAAAAAMLDADARHRTLLVSTDPAHSVGDVLGTPLRADPRAVGDHLWAAEIDAEAEAAAHVRRIADEVGDSIDRDLWPAVRRHLDLAASSPGTVESAVFERVAALMAQVAGAEPLGGQPAEPAWDRLVFDTAPTGHTLRLLALPALLGVWAEGLTRQREKVAGMDRMLRNMAGSEADPADDPVLARLRDRRDRFAEARHRLEQHADIWLVLVPERLPIEETVRARATLLDAGLSIAGVIVNRVLPDDAEGAFLTARREQQADYLDEIDRRLPDRPHVRVAQQPRDITERAQLEDVARELALGGVGG